MTRVFESDVNPNMFMPDLNQLTLYDIPTVLHLILLIISIIIIEKYYLWLEEISIILHRLLPQSGTV